MNISKFISLFIYLSIYYFYCVEHLCGKERITEVVSDLELTVSPRSYLCINTHGADHLYQTISQTLGKQEINYKDK